MKQKVAWDLFVGILILYSVIIIPFRLGFAAKPSPEGEGFDWYKINYFIPVKSLPLWRRFIIFRFDIIFRFVSQHYNFLSVSRVVDNCFLSGVVAKFWSVNY